MSVVLLVIDGVLLVGIVGVSLYGASRLPAGARLPLHFGPPGTPTGSPRSSPWCSGPPPPWWSA
jgi:hypothetical protein